MTVHQAKGLEFPVVFVARTDETARPDSQHLIEQETNQFRRSPITMHRDSAQKAREDLHRILFRGLLPRSIRSHSPSQREEHNTWRRTPTRILGLEEVAGSGWGARSHIRGLADVGQVQTDESKVQT